MPMIERSRSIQFDLSIIIVNWNSLDYLRACLQSIVTSSKDVVYEIIVVDNASTIDPTPSLQAQFPRVITIRLPRNVGFSAANNVGFRHSSGHFVLFLNPDTEVIEDALAQMVKALNQLPDAGILGARLLNTDGTVQTSCIQRFPTILNQLLDAEALRSRWPSLKFWGMAPLLSRSETPSSVEVVSGACLMMPADVFEAVGGFSEAYFMYAEDVDLCHRVRQLGRKAYFTPAATVLHHGGGPSKARNGSAWVAVMQRRAILQFCRQVHGPTYAAVYRLSTALVAGARLLCLALLGTIYAFSAHRQRIRQATGKWASVLTWALGLKPPVLAKQ